MRETLFNYPKVYLLQQVVGSRQEKEREYWNWDDCVSLEKQHIRVRKRERTQTLNFLPSLFFYWISNILVSTSQNGCRKLSSLHTLATCVRLYVFISSRLVVNSQKYKSSPSLHLVSAERTSTSPGSAHAYKIMRPPVVSSHPQLMQSFPRNRLIHNCLSLTPSEIN